MAVKAFSQPVIIGDSKSVAVLVRVEADPAEAVDAVIASIRGALSYAQASGEFPRTFDVFTAARESDTTGAELIAVVDSKGRFRGRRVVDNAPTPVVDPALPPVEVAPLDSVIAEQQTAVVEEAAAADAAAKEVAP